MYSIRSIFLIGLCSFLSENTFGLTSADSGWVPVFNGKNLTGLYTFGSASKQDTVNFKPLPDSNQLRISNGVTGFISTEKIYSRYRMRVQYRASGNTGLLYHINQDKSWPDGLEIQTMPGDAGSLWTTKAWVNTTVDPKNETRYLGPDSGGIAKTIGAATGRLHIVKNARRDVTGWNTIEIFVWDDSLEVSINGHVTVRCSKVRTAGTGNTQIPLVKGTFGLQAEGAITYFRNWEMIDLNATTSIKAHAHSLTNKATPSKISLKENSGISKWFKNRFFRMNGKSN